MQRGLGVGSARGSVTGCAIALVLTQTLAGCAHVQLNQNALDLSGSLSSLARSQVLQNVGETARNPYHVPSQAQVGGGTVATSSAVNPTVSAPFNAQSTLTTGTMGTNSVNTDALQRSAATLQVALQHGWTQGWTLNPQTDPDTLRRLRALYRYALGLTPSADGQKTLASVDNQFMCEYPPNTTYGQPAQGDTYSKICQSGHKISISLDKSFEVPPSCVLCRNMDAGDSVIYVNESLEYGFIQTYQVDKGWKSIGTYGGAELFICKDKAENIVPPTPTGDYESPPPSDGSLKPAVTKACDGERALEDLILFTYEAMGASSALGGKTNGGKSGGPLVLVPGGS